MARVPFLTKEGLEVEGGASIIGDLGIGCTDPASNLEVRSAGQAIARVQGVDPYMCGLKLRNNQSSVQSDWNLAAAGGSSGWGGTNGNFIIRDDTTNSTAIEFERGAGGATGALYIDSASKVGIRGTVQVGENDLGHDVTFYGDTSGKSMLWDASADSLQLNGSMSVYGGFGVGQDGTGHNVFLYGDTLGSWVKWDWSNDSLRFTDSTPIEIGDNQDMSLYHDGTNSYITNITGTLNILANHGASNSKNVNIGGSTSVVTIGDNLTVTDTLTELSMREMKTNIEPIENILPSVLQMQGVQFDWKKDEDRGLTNYGFIAEDVDKILPNLVSHDEEGKAQGIQYSKMTAVLLEAIKEQQVQIDELKSKIN